MDEPDDITLGDFNLLEMPVSIRQIGDSRDRELAWQFFVFFSRMEYALKRSRYLVKGKIPAEPDWDAFANKHDNQFCGLLSPKAEKKVSAESLKRLETAVVYFQQSPPRKQIVEGGALGWSEPQSKNDGENVLRWLLRVVRIVRNNLFHGGKFPGSPVNDPSRDRQLLTNSITVLIAAELLDPEVRGHVEETIA
jgi:hypothetical protein